MRAFGIAVVATVALLAAAGAVADVRLTLPATAQPGGHATGVRVRTARLDLAAGLPRGLAAAVDRAQLQASGATGRLGQLRSDAFVFGSAGTAGRVLSAWRRVHHARAMKVGGISYFSARRNGIVVAWRHGSRVGVIALRASRATHDPGARALGYAVLADGWLRSPLPTTAWGKVVDQIRPDGTVSKQTALEAFAVVYGPLPGVRTPRGPRVRLTSNLLPGAWALRYISQVSPRLRRLIYRRLRLTPPGTRLAHVADFGDPTFHEDAKLDATANHWASIYADPSHLNHPLPYKIVAGLSTAVPPWAATFPVDINGTYSITGPYCRIQVNPATLTSKAPPLDLALAHEVFHCFQFALDPNWGALPGWILEGMADWAALTVDPVSWDAGGQNLKTYITTPHTPLFTRTYDAVGFWGHSEDVVPNSWARIQAILNVGSNEGAFHLAYGDDDAFLTTWGSSYFRASAGTPWQMRSPITPPGYGGLPIPALEIGPLMLFQPVHAPPFTTSQYLVNLDPERPLLHVSITGHARMGLTYNYTKLEDTWFCLIGTPCVCPPDTTGTVPPALPISSGSALGLSGDPKSGTEGELNSYSLSAFCHPNKEPPGSNTGISNGDPYITNFDRKGFGFQLAGEFTLVKSTVDDLEIQSRQVPYRLVLGWGGNSLAMNTAFAMRDGGATVEVDKGSPLVLYIDHRRRHAHPGEVISLNGGGTVRYTTKQVVVTWADGTQATVLSIGSEGVNIDVTPSPSRAGHLTGLMGSDHGKPADDFVGRDGRRYNPKTIESVGLFASTRAAVRILLGGFGRSWRITQAESLFVYPPGKSTRSYLVPGFPRAIISLRSLPALRRLAAARACAGVTDTLRVGCEIDFGATGNHLLVAATRVLQHAAGLPPATVDLSGQWSGQYSGRFSGTFTLTWHQSGSKLNGTIKLSNPRRTLGIRGTVSGKTIRFGYVGGVAYSGSVVGDSMSGSYRSPVGGGSWSATKISD